MIESFMDFNPDILKRFFDGNYTQEEFGKIKDIFTDVKERAALKSYLSNHWEIFLDQNEIGAGPEHLLYKIHHRLRLEERNKNSFLVIFQKIAAILIIPILLSFVGYVFFKSGNQEGYSNYNNDAYAEIQCPSGARTEFMLPDGTTGYLNSNSSIRYSVNFNQERDVFLTGEAYFDVFHDEKKPFLVHTNNLKISVLGTKFNLISYDDSSEEEVILNQGMVKVLSNRDDELAILNPNHKLKLNKENNSFQITEVDASQYIGWTNGKLIFRDENMQKVAERLGRWYNVDIDVIDNELLKYSFHATFIDEPLEEVLRLMALTAPFYFEEQPRKIKNNIYGKRKVLIKLDEEKLKSFH